MLESTVSGSTCCGIVGSPFVWFQCMVGCCVALFVTCVMSVLWMVILQEGFER